MSLIFSFLPFFCYCFPERSFFLFFEDESLVGNNEPVKRQRRWNTESLKVPEPQSSNLTATTPKDMFQSPTSKRLARVDSNNSEDSPKERVGKFHSILCCGFR